VIVVVVTQTGGRAALGGTGGTGIGGGHLVLLMHRFFQRVLLFPLSQILSHGVVDLRRFRQLLPWNARRSLSAGGEQTGPFYTVSRKPFHQPPIADEALSVREVAFAKMALRKLRGFRSGQRLWRRTTGIFHLRLMTNTVLSSIRSVSQAWLRFSSCFTACSRMALQTSFAGSSRCSRMTCSICSRA
jgi:hypothetical protein